MKFAARGMCLLATLVISTAGGATEWSDTRTAIDEVVADTATLPPTSALEPLRARIPFKNFRYPYVDPQQNVTFIADDPLYAPTGSDGDNLGIYRSYAADGKLEALVSAHDTIVPGTTDARFRFIRGLHMGGNLSDFVFSGIATDGANGIYLWRDGKLEVVARSGETTLDGDLVQDVEYASFSGGQALYVAHLKSGPALVLYHLQTGTQQVLLRSGQPAPGDTGATFEYFSPQNWVDDGQVLLRAARVRNPYDGDGPAKAERGLYGWVSAPGLPKPDYTLASLRRFLDWTTPIPGYEKGRFINIRSAPIHQNLLTFVGECGSHSGVYWMKTSGGAVEMIVDTSTAIEGLFEGNFTDFNIYPALIDRSIIFVGYARDYVGIFLYRPDRDELLLLTDSRTEVEGRKIKSFETASHCLIGDRLAVKAKFADRTEGVYLATIPDQALPRLSARK